MKVLHIGDEMNWRGGENQVRLLIEGLKLPSVVAYPRNSLGIDKFSNFGPVVEMPSAKPYDPRNLRILKKAVEEHGIDLIDAQSSGAHSLGLSLKKIFPEIPLIVHRRVDNEIKKGFFSKQKYLSSKVGGYIAISDKIRSILVEYGVDPQKIHLVRSAVPGYDLSSKEKWLRREELANAYGISSSVPLIGCVGAMKIRQKGQDVLLKAMAELHKKSFDFHGVFAGSGDDLEPMKKLASDLGLEGKVLFLGQIEDVQRFLTGIDILSVPSRNEGLGTIIIDGFYARCVVVASDVGGIPELIQNGKTGYLVPPDDFEQLAEKLKYVMERFNNLAVLKARAVDKAIQEFSVDAMVQGNLSVYQSVLNEARHD